MTDKIHVLPLEEVSLLRALHAAEPRPQHGGPLRLRLAELHSLGYSYAAIAAGAGVSRQRVHQIVAEELGVPKTPSAKASPQVKLVPPATAELLRWAWTASAPRRGSTHSNSLPTAAHTVLIDTVTDLVRDGVRFAAIADAVGVEQGAVRGRMLRAGITKRGVQAQTGDVA
jgi:hypothetical protein